MVVSISDPDPLDLIERIEIQRLKSGHLNQTSKIEGILLFVASGASMRLSCFFVCVGFSFLLGRAGAQSELPANTGSSNGLIRRTPESLEKERQAERHIILDVVVTDPSGKPVSGLRQQDFTLQDGAIQEPITSFEAVNGSTARPPVQIIIVLDTMNATFQDVVTERQGIEKFLRKNGGHLRVPVSIVFLTDTDAKLNKPSNDGNALADDLAKLDTPVRVLGPAQGYYGALDRLGRSIRTLEMLSPFEAEQPGRKLLLWMGPGWPLMSGPTPGMTAKDKRRYFASIVEITTQLRKAHITLYDVAPLNMSEGDGNKAFLYLNFLKGVESPKEADAPNLALQVLAVHSGGQVLDRSGDVAGEIAQCVADLDSYYEISFDASPSIRANEYHPLKITIDKAGLTARTNTSYYGTNK
jgi:VWFA-related protein